jgi:type I restriction enzyme S subunit
MMLMRTKRERYLPALLMHVLNSPDINSRVRDLTGGSASPHLNVATIKGFPVPVPPLEEQHEMVRRVEALFKLADAIEQRVEAATRRADKLTQAILGKAFRGELVPTEAELARRAGRTYEPASALLERIRASRAFR